MSDLAWNSLPSEEEEPPRATLEELRALAKELEGEEYDDAVVEFLGELRRGADPRSLRQAATLLLQDEIDLAPELADMGVEPDEALIELLIACGADLDARNAYGQPPLHLAARYGYESIVDMLLSAGASARCRNDKGQLPAALAATPELAAKLAPAPTPGNEGEPPLPPEVEDADWEDELRRGHEREDHDCGCHHEHGEHECSCGHRHEHGEHDCDCGHDHEGPCRRE